MFMTLARTISVLYCMASLLVLSSGCSGGPEGPVRYETSGIVTNQGKLVADAQVVFYLTSQGVSRGAITDEAGRFEVKAGLGNGLPVGEYSLVIRPAPRGDVERINLNRPDIPKKYWYQETSDLQRSIVEGKNYLELNLEDKN